MSCRTQSLSLRWRSLTAPQVLFRRPLPRQKALSEKSLPAPVSREGPSTEPAVIFARLKKLALPYWTDETVGTQAKWRLAGVVLLTVATTGVSVGFNFIGRDFFNALSEKNVEVFTRQLLLYLGAFVVGIPVFVFRDYFQSMLSNDWRQWMAKKYLEDYMENRAFYKVQSLAALDNPDQRISVDVTAFTSTALGFVLTLLNAGIDLVSFSEILFSIYPPLFVALILYAVGGTYLTIQIGKPLVGLNFRQEAKEADFRFGLVRVRENAESIAFYSGEKKETNILSKRLEKAVLNTKDLLKAARNLDFFTSFYRYLIMLLPAAVVAPIFFKGEIGFGVVTQSQSAFAHILSDISLVVYQFEALAGFSAVIDRLGEFSETIEELEDQESPPVAEQITLESHSPSQSPQDPLLSVHNLTLRTPDSKSVLIRDLSFELRQGDSLLIMGPSGAGKTSLLRAIAGLWTTGSGVINRYGSPIGANNKSGTIMFVPQRPYIVLGSLRDNLLYPTWTDIGSSSEDNESEREVPDDLRLEKAMILVNLEDLLLRCRQESEKNPLDLVTDWSSQLSIGEQQRLAFARILLSEPQLLILDESTSALDVTNEQLLYRLLDKTGVSYVSVGHRPTLKDFHSLSLTLSPAEKDQQGAQWTLKATKMD